MPTVLDATVVARADSTAGNGGRKIDSNKYGFFEVTYTSTTFYLHKTTAEGSSSQVYSLSGFASIQDVSLVATDKKILVLALLSNTSIRVYEFDAQTGANASNYFQSPTPTIAFNGLGKGSIIANDEGTEVYVSWDGKATNPNYASSFNIFYNKATINADGNVVWGAVEQWTYHNSNGLNFNNPSISLTKGGKPIILTDSSTATAYHIVALGGDITTFDVIAGGNNRPNKSIYNGGAFAQSYPSAIFVPQSVNGLANGRIWVAWHGLDATDTSTTHIRVSYSDDGGATWSAMQKLTNGGGQFVQANPSITANKNNEIFILWNAQNGTVYHQKIRKIKNSNGVWGSISDVVTIATNYNLYNPSTLFDLSVNFTEPLFIYKNEASPKVGFYGTWTVTTISVMQGSIGTKSDKNNLLTYSITTDGSMSTITEKVNGVTIGTKTATSGQSLIAGLTKEQWDAVRFGKYADATGGKNTLTIEMGSEKWTYTFDKRLASDSEISSVVKAVKDLNEVELPTIKNLLVDKVGGNPTDSFEKIIENIELGVEKSTGTISSSSSTINFTTYNGSTASKAFIPFDMTKLPFVPAYIQFRLADKSNGNAIYTIDWFKDDVYYYSSGNFGNVALTSTMFRVPYTNGVVNIPSIAGGLTLAWTAYASI